MVTASNTVIDPRTAYWVSFGLWPDCPDCEGLLMANHQWVYNHTTEFDLGHNQLVPPPCPKCVSRTTQSGSGILTANHQPNTSAPYGTWPDCPECHGYGGHKEEVSFDGHRSDYAFFACQTCQKRTADFHQQHPTNLDHLLQDQQANLEPLLNQRQTLKAQLKQVENDIASLQLQQSSQLKPYLNQIVRQLQRTELLGQGMLD